jgi:hypothetical protein
VVCVNRLPAHNRQHACAPPLRLRWHSHGSCSQASRASVSRVPNNFRGLAHHIGVNEQPWNKVGLRENCKKVADTELTRIEVRLEPSDYSSAIRSTSPDWLMVGPLWWKCWSSRVMSRGNVMVTDLDCELRAAMPTRPQLCACHRKHGEFRTLPNPRYPVL